LLFTYEQLGKKWIPGLHPLLGEEITQINDEAVPENTKKATKFGLAVFKGNVLSL